MALDDALASDATPTARFFTWDPPAVSLGWRQPCPEWLKAARGPTARFEIVERPTGGGIAIHGSDVSIAVVIPRALGRSLDAMMRTVCQSAARLCRWYGVEAMAASDAPGAGRIVYCLAEPSPYAVLVGHRKVAGFAIRRYPASWLIQGSLLIRPLSRALTEAMPSEDRQRLEDRALPLVCVATAPVTEPDAASQWAERWAAWWQAPAVEPLPLAA